MTDQNLELSHGILNQSKESGIIPGKLFKTPPPFLRHGLKKTAPLQSTGLPLRGWTLLIGNTRPECFLRGLKFSDKK